MIVFIAPDSNQVMAIYSDETNSRVWEDEHGYVKYEVPETLEARLTKAARDGYVTITSGVITGIKARKNDIQLVVNPTRLRIAELSAKLTADTVTFDELKELMRLERGL